MKTSQSIFYVLFLVILFLTLKVLFIFSQTADLKVLLFPISTLIEWMTGSAFHFSDDKGFYFEQLNVTINKSCSGFNFFLLSFLLLSFLTLKNCTLHRSKILFLLVSFFSAYLITILANTSRIYCSIVLQNKLHTLLKLDVSIIHESIGIVNNLCFLITTFYLFEKIIIKHSTYEKLAIS